MSSPLTGSPSPLSVYGRLLSMMVSWWRLWLWMGLLLVVAATAGSVVFVLHFHSGSQESAAGMVSALVMFGFGLLLISPPDERSPHQQGRLR